MLSDFFVSCVALVQMLCLLDLEQGDVVFNFVHVLKRLDGICYPKKMKVGL